MLSFFTFINYCSHQLFAQKGKYAHSPFIYNMSLEIFDKKNNIVSLQDIQKQFGKNKYAQLLVKTALYFKTKNIIIISKKPHVYSLYLTISSENTNVFSVIEKETEKFTQYIFNYEESYIYTYKHSFSFLDLFSSMHEIDMLIMDESLSPEAVYRYFKESEQHTNNNSIFVFENLYRSPETALLWKIIKAHPQITVTLDLFGMCLAFFRKESSKENFIIKY